MSDMADTLLPAMITLDLATSYRSTVQIECASQAQLFYDSLRLYKKAAIFMAILQTGFGNFWHGRNTQ